MTARSMDPWGDVHRWSDDEPDAVPDAAPEVGSELGIAPASGDAGARTCPWCATPAAEDAACCSSCDAALAQRESIGDLVIPGLTAVDPALKDLDGRPLRLAGPSPSHAVASGAIVAAAAGGPLGLAILGGVGAVAAAEYLGASRGRPGRKGLDKVGETSDAVRLAVERLDRGEVLPTAWMAENPEDAEAQSAGHVAGAEEANDGGH